MMNSEAQRGSSAQGREGRRPAVLVVEDDRDIRSSLAELLGSEGYDVATAENGAVALTQLRTRELPDVVLLDLMMPVMDGWQFRIEQRRDPVLARVPVIALSANASAQARAVDAAAFLPKPLDTGALMAAIERVISQAELERTANVERMAALGTLAAGIAHEINNPLSYVMVNLQLAARQLPGALREADHEVTRLVQESLHGAERIASIVREIQLVSQLRRDQQAAVDVREVIEGVLRLIKHEVRQRARLTTEYAPAPPVQIDRVRLEQVLINLVVNAVQAIGEGRAQDNYIRLSLGMAPDGSGRVQIEIADSGCGISDLAKARLFQPFFTTKPPGSGTGLGLSMTRAIVTAAGGDIAFESAVGQGTVFRVRLPPMPPGRGRDGAAAARGDRTGSGCLLPRLRILAVDDEPTVLRALQRLLERHHDVVAVGSGKEALELAPAGAFDVLLCDLAMPDMSGVEVAERVAAAVPALAERTVFLTGGAFTPSARAVVDRGHYLVVDKPFTLQSLTSALEVLLTGGVSGKDGV
jgi:signal transduction histidine kinase